ncbi:hypothetical protein [Bathymodiolus platifrons methanotrophic gill symbiont]|uniref:hypothetical protein n=1 Tax=Bathymodiolus platifrons methanotrophic gill symbiont TaxID=113268 RepID=UPI001C8D1A34|nr:hypothetical protein [Bathymodiolus platifrons methanotrophic gill symbiont]
MNTSGWKIDLQEDHAIANDLLNEIKKVTPEHDKKLQDLKQFIANKVNNLINGFCRINLLPNVICYHNSKFQ